MRLFRKVFRRESAQPLRLYQLHEHLAIVDAGV